MLKGEISLNFMSDRPLANLILSFLVISLWKTHHQFFLFWYVFTKNIPCANHLALGSIPWSVVHVLPASHPPGYSSFPQVGIYSELFILGGKHREAVIFVDSGSPGPFVLMVVSQAEWRVPEGEDYFSIVNAALQNPLDINVWCLRLGEARAGTFSCEGVYICGTLLNICCGFPTAAMLKLWG